MAIKIWQKIKATGIHDIYRVAGTCMVSDHVLGPLVNSRAVFLLSLAFRYRERDTLILLLHFFSDFPTRQDFRFQAANLATSCIFHLLAHLILRRIFQNRKSYEPMTRISKCAMLYLKFISKYYFFSVSLREIRICFGGALKSVQG